MRCCSIVNADRAFISLPELVSTYPSSQMTPPVCSLFSFVTSNLTTVKEFASMPLPTISNSIVPLVFSHEAAHTHTHMLTKWSKKRSATGHACKNLTLDVTNFRCRC